MKYLAKLSWLLLGACALTGAHETFAQSDGGADGGISTGFPFCDYALTNALSCADSSSCPVERPLCTRDVNQQLHHAWTEGHCVDPTGGLSATNAIQADLCTIPDPKGWGAATPYSLPAASRLLIDDPDGSGTALTIYRRVIFEGQGASIATNPVAATYVTIRVVVPLDQVEFQYPSGDKYAAFSTLRDLAITSSPHISNLNTGVLIQAHNTKVENFKCWHMGLCVDVDGLGDKFNADHSAVEDLTAFGQYGAGIYLHGADSNNFVGTRPECNSGPCIRDSSFLVSTWIAPMVEQSGEHASNHPNFQGQFFSLWFEGNHTAIFNGYAEGSQPDIYAANSTVVAYLTNFSTRISPVAERFGGGWSKAQFQSPGLPYALQFGGPYGAIFFQSRPNSEGVPAENYGWRLRMQNYGTKWYWVIDSEDQSIPPPLRFRSSDIADERGRVVPSPKLEPESGPTQCCDTVDNDLDGKIDCFEPACGSESCC